MSDDKATERCPRCGSTDRDFFRMACDRVGIPPDPWHTSATPATGSTPKWEVYDSQEAGHPVVACHSLNVGGVLCRWWGAIEPEGVKMIEQALVDAARWKSEFEMYRTAWLREMGGKLCRKSHDIDAFVKTTKFHYERSLKWQAYENRNTDPFWMVPEPKEEVQHGE